MSGKRRRGWTRRRLLDLTSPYPEAIAESRRQASPLSLVLFGGVRGVSSGTGDVSLLLAGLSKAPQRGESFFHGRIAHAADLRQVAGEAAVMAWIRPLILSGRMSGSVRTLLLRSRLPVFLVPFGLGIGFGSWIEIDATVSAC